MKEIFTIRFQKCNRLRKTFSKIMRKDMINERMFIFFGNLVKFHFFNNCSDNRMQCFMEKYHFVPGYIRSHLQVCFFPFYSQKIHMET